MTQQKIRKSLRRNALALASMAALGFAAIDAHAAPMTKPAYRDALSGALVHADTIEDGRTYSRFIVKFEKNSPPGRDVAAANASINALGRGNGRQLGLVRRLAIGADLVEVDGAPLDAAQAEALMADIARNPHVEYVEPDRIMQIALSPNDTRYAEQWHYFDAVAGMNLPAAWDIGTGTGVVVAVIDTGITPHADLSANVVAGYDFITSTTTSRDGNGRDSNPNDEGDWFAANECGVPYSSNSSWHGTHVAGTVAAVTNNASGVAGVAFGAKVQPVRVLGKCGGSTSDIADAMVWASGGTVSGVPANPTPAKVLNLSLGGSGACGSTFQNAVNSATSRGSVVVIAAGNSNADVANFSPGNCSGVISVAASDKEGNRASYSNYGSLIDVTAPGGETATTSKGVLSTLNTGTTTQGSASYAFYQGTSMAAPHVAGLAAMVLSKAPTLTPSALETLLKNNTRPLAGTCSGGCGAGLVDSLKTMQAATGGGGGGGGGNTLTNGVAATGLAASTG
ncbi:MAG TPA: S8 family serine peptidase, partial [Xanthomonadales bacterium]|nr:S8 family serine peptidase [Xanthomonadales bacterium]